MIEALKSQGYNQSQIAEMFKVSRQAVSWHLKTVVPKISDPDDRAEPIVTVLDRVSGTAGALCRGQFRTLRRP